jgi:hypothetical protein
MSIADRIGPLMLPDLPLAACKGDYAFTERPAMARRKVCTGCPERGHCLFSALHSERRRLPLAVARLTEPGAHRTRRAPQGGRALSDKVCESCGNGFTGHGRSRYCSRTCAKREQCGTVSGLAAHTRNRERLCERCLAAQREYVAQRKGAA